MNLPKTERVPARGLGMIAIILITIALLALYANVQKFRRDKIETVIVTPLATPTASPKAP